MLGKCLGIAALLALSTSAARADWEGDIEMKARMDRHAGGQAPTGKVRFKEGKMKMEIQYGPMNMTSLADFPARKVYLINNDAKSYSEMSSDQAGPGGPGNALPQCKSLKFTACMKEQGFKKGASEEVNGQASTIWEGDRKTGRGTHHEKIWHPDAAGEEFAFVRVESGQGERANQVNILNWTKAEQDAALFQVPADFTKSQGFPGLMGPGGLGGKGSPKGRGKRVPPQAADAPTTDAPTGGETTEGKEKVEQ